MSTPVASNRVRADLASRKAHARVVPGLLVLTMCGCGNPQERAGGSGQRSGEPGHARTAGGHPSPTERSMSDILSKLDSLNITVTLQPDTEARQDELVKLRSVWLSVSSSMIEPPGTWPDGQPISAHAQVSPEQAKAVLSRLVECEFFKAAQKYHSPRNAHPRARPPEGSRGILEEKLAREASMRAMHVRVTVNDSDWYTYYVGSYEWRPAIGDFIDVLRAPLEGEAARALASLRRQLHMANWGQ